MLKTLFVVVATIIFFLLYVFFVVATTKNTEKRREQRKELQIAFRIFTMDAAFSAFFESPDSFNNFHQISTTVQSHLKLVYLSLCCALLASAAGVYLHQLWDIGGFLTSLGLLASFVWLRCSPPYEGRKRVALMMASALFGSASIDPLIHLATQIDTSILITAFVGAGLASACFSLAAMLARRREYLYLGGVLSSGLSILLWLQFAAFVFGGSTALFKFELYIGLLVFVRYIVVETQDILEKAHHGDRDYVKHALNLFTAFIRILINHVKEGRREE